MKLALEGVLKKPQGKQKYWAIGVPLLEIYSQGKSKNNALVMIKEAIEGAVGKKEFKIEVQLTGESTFAVCANQFAYLIAFMLKQQRTTNNLTFRSVAKKLGSASPNAYSRYEHGKASTSLDKLVELMGAVNNEKYLLLKTW